MGNRNGKAWKRNKRASQVEVQMRDHLLANFDKYLLKEIHKWCHVFHIEKEKKIIYNGPAA